MAMPDLAISEADAPKYRHAPLRSARTLSGYFPDLPTGLPMPVQKSPPAAIV
jgi:hypothetical protein